MTDPQLLRLLRDRIRERKLSPADLAREAGINYSLAYRIASGQPQALVSWKNVSRLVSYLLADDMASLDAGERKKFFE